MLVYIVHAITKTLEAWGQEPVDGELAEDTERTFKVLSFIVALGMEPMALCN